VSGPAFSVALASYNGADFIEKQLESILLQTLRPVEIVVSDDGSTDDTAEIVARVMTRASGFGVDVRWLPAEPDDEHGVTANFARACAACRQEIVALADQDDLWPEGKLARLAEEFDRRPDLELLFTDATLVDARGASLDRTLFGRLEVTGAELADIRSDRAFDVLLRRNLATGATMAFRRRLLAHALPFPRSWVHDEWLAIVAAERFRIDALAEPLLFYRQHGSNQIGVAEPTIRRKIGRVLESRGARNRILAERAGVLLERMETWSPPASSEHRAAAAGKRSFEQARAALSPHRLARLGPIFGLAARGGYRRFASRGSADILRDLLQKA
jgi:glycosyltransferase involved in cell wall biosynthesis